MALFAFRETVAQTTVADAVRRVVESPELAHGRVGVEVYSIADHTVRYQRDGDKLFTPASTTKLVSTGAALALLGPDYRFHTRVYRTGPIREGVLDGNVVIVASGDANLSGRVQSDGTLAFVDQDHSEGGMPVPGDPVAPLTKLARDIAMMGVRRITGTVLIDASIFAEGDHEGGAGTTFSPIVVNDNEVDVIVTPGLVGQTPTIRMAPKTAHIRFVNHLTTGQVGSASNVGMSPLVLDDGTREVTLTGSVPQGQQAFNVPYAVDTPSRFAADILISALENAGVAVSAPSQPTPIDGTIYASSYRADSLLADIVSPPLSEDVRITLKVSQNLHAGLIPYLIGSVVCKAKTSAKEAGMRRIQSWLRQAGLDPSAAMMGDGFGLNANFTPDFVAHYLAFMTTQPAFPQFEAGLPILGRDGTLANIQKRSPAAGRVFAKTGTITSDDFLNGGLMVESKALAGYTTGPKGEPLAFAIYINKAPLQAKDGVSADDRVGLVAGEAVGSIAAAINLLPVGG
jgi:D-alanyl-D-alanine carboxypeptidase/D-alanyl-D-alanine-endopeptidase (penicillin-binding protein 4)